MKRHLQVLCLAALLVGLWSGMTAASAQSTAFKPGDTVLVLETLPVYARNGSQLIQVAELVTNVRSRIDVLETDGDVTWAYMLEDAFGWVQLDDPAAQLRLYSDEALAQRIEEATAAINANPSDVDAYIARGTAYRVQRNFSAALADFNAALNRAVDTGFIYEYIGKVQLDAGDYEAAMETFDIQIYELERALGSTYNRNAIAYERAYGPDFAALMFDEAIEAVPQYGLLYANMGIQYYNLSDYSTALDYYNRALRVDPYLYHVYSQLANVYIEMGNYQAALDSVNEGISLNPVCEDCYYTRVYLYSDFLGDQDQTLADYSRSVEIDPYDGDNWANLGIVYMETGDYAEAVTDLKQAVDLDPRNAHAHYNLAFSQSIVGDYEAALDHYATALDISDRWDASIYLYRPQVYIAVGQFKDALNDSDAYVGNSIDTSSISQIYFSISALVTRAVISVNTADYDAALQALLTANALDEEALRNYSLWSAGYRVTPQRATLVSAFQDAIAASPSDVKAYLQLANLYLEFGLWEQAEIQYKEFMGRASNADPELLPLIELLQSLH